METSDLSCGVFALAERCGVDMADACARAGIAVSTPRRWRSGTRPHASLVARLRQAVYLIASEQGTVPADLLGEAGAAGGVKASIARIRRELDLLEWAVGGA